MPKTLARSVIAKAGMPSAAARATASSMRTIPSVIENSLWSRRWTKAGFGIGLRGTGEAKILPPAFAAAETVLADAQSAPGVMPAAVDGRALLGARARGGRTRE